MRLACKLWLPQDALEKPVPAILEYIPYRKRDIEAVQDSIAHGYFAGHGYAGVRVDLRGATRKGFWRTSICSRSRTTP